MNLENGRIRTPYEALIDKMRKIKGEDA